MDPVTDAVVTDVPEPAHSPPRPMLGPAFTYKEINFLRWTILVIAALVSFLKALYLHFQNGGFQGNFQGDFVYFYAFGRILSQYPAARLYDYALQQKICDQLHPLATLAYGPNPYAPFIAVLFQPFAHIDYFAAYLL